MNVVLSTDGATRETFETISSTGQVVFYVLSALAVIAFVYGVYLRVQRYTQGGEDWFNRLSVAADRIKEGSVTIASNQNQFDRDWFAGAMHAFVMTGFLVLFIATSILFIDEGVREIASSFWVGDFYLSYQFVVDAFGLLFVVGILMAMHRRYFVKSTRLWDRHTNREDDVFIFALLAIGVTGFLLEGLRIYINGIPSHEAVSFVGYSIALAIDAGASISVLIGAETAHWGMWWIHTIVSLAFIAWIPYSKPFHMLSSAASILTKDEKAGKRLPGVPADIDADTGVTSIDDLSWRELLEQDACTKCGRCSAVCPAKSSGRPLDPRNVILDLKQHRDSGDDSTPIIADGGAVIDSTTMESCMACMACMDACPVEIEHLKSFTHLNRQLVEDGEIDPNVQDVFEQVMRNGNTLGEQQRKRADWANDIDVEPADARSTDVEYLWYVGDRPSFDDRNKKLAKSLAKIFDQAGISWGILYEDERYNGNDIRRLGEELLFLELAGHHVEQFEKCDPDTIVCTDPHSFNTFKNEYPEVDFTPYADDPMMPFDVEGYWNEDGEVDVAHWTQVVADLMEDDKIDIDTTIDRDVTFHDPCHLGRYNEVYNAPRELIETIGCELYEMPRNREDSYCCGGGGGGLWLDPPQDEKASEDRLTEALDETDGPVDTFVVTCPLCVTMYEDGRKTGGFEEEIDVVGLSELVAEAVDDSTPSKT